METKTTKITKGEWSVRFLGGEDNGENDFFIEAPNFNKPELGYGIEIMQDDYGDHNGYPRDQRLSDAELIVEAGNVTNETGYTPRELLKHRNDLLKTLRHIGCLVNSRNLPSEWFKSEHVSDVNALIGRICEARLNAIKKATS